MKNVAQKNWVIGNWKLNPLFADAQQLFQQISAEYATLSQGCHIAIAPPMPYVGYFAQQKGGVPIVAQDISTVAELGAFTGETSAKLLQSTGVNYVLIGHSERREHFADDDVRLQQKVKNALAADLTIIYCVGESLAQREAGQALTVVLEQVAVLAAVLTKDDWSKVIIAYEPIWAIGTGKTASPSDAQEVHAAIRAGLTQYTTQAAEISLLYGGSVKAENAVELAACADIDGALVGGASLDAASFISIIHAFSQQ